MSYKTEQESFWAGKFGNEYINRNMGDKLLASNLSFFSKALNKTSKISSCIEFGANIGMNLNALSLIFPKMDLCAVEINEAAVNILKDNLPKALILNKSILDFSKSNLNVDGNIFFEIEAYPKYGKFVNISDDLETEDNELSKKNRNDFTLWKAKKDSDGDIFWNSAFGMPSRPSLTPLAVPENITI